MPATPAYGQGNRARVFPKIALRRVQTLAARKVTLTSFQR
jgi:hypothetical protein